MIFVFLPHLYIYKGENISLRFYYSFIVCLQFKFYQTNVYRIVPLQCYFCGPYECFESQVVHVIAYVKIY